MRFANPGERVRAVKALLAATAVAVALLNLIQYVVFPEIRARITPAQTAWLREAFRTHPALVLLAILVTVAVLGLPILLTALWVWSAGKRNVTLP